MLWAVRSLHWGQIFFNWKLNFNGFCKSLLRTKAVLIASLNNSIIDWSMRGSEWKKGIWTNIHVSYWLLIWINDISKRRESAQIPIEQHCQISWKLAKALGLSLAWFWIDCNQSLQPKQSKMKFNVESHVDTSCLTSTFHLSYVKMKILKQKKLGQGCKR